ncbi:MAG: periplasmic heavy metal sensor [Chloroflexi bacterium]|nr:periplasmic heavy metal sensor [Chloroflexota bacterium]
MKRAVCIVLLGLVLGLTACCAIYLAGMAPHRAMLHSKEPELAWLREEFHLSAAEFERISQLHAAYLPECAERCRRINAKNAELKKLLARRPTPTLDIEKALTDAAQLRLECQKSMLKHFIEVSQTMPPEQGQRYLVWVQEKTLLSAQGMERSH